METTMKTNVKTSLLIATLATIAGVISTQVKKRGGVKPAIEDLKAGTANAVKAVKGSPAGQAAAKVVGTIGSRPANDGAAVDEAELGNTAPNLVDDELKTGTHG